MSRRNRMIVRKVRNIVILLMAIVVMIGAYKNIRDSRAEDVIEIDAIAIDNYGYLSNELFKLEATQIGDELYEIELPESVNGKEINQIITVTLEEPIPEVETESGVQENASNENTVETEDDETISPEDESGTTVETPEVETPAEEETPEEDTLVEDGETTEPDVTQTPTEPTEENTLEITDNKIILTKEQLDTKQLNIEVTYRVAILETDEQGEFVKNLLSEKTEEERKEIEIAEETQVLYSKILKYEDEEKQKLVEVKGFLPKDAELKVEEVTQEQLTEIFGEAKIDVAYDIKIVIHVTKEVLIDETDPTKGTTEIIETIEVNPEEFGESCEVSIKDIDIKTESQVYHVKEDNTYESVPVKENTEENITFDANTFSIYAITTDEQIMLSASSSAFYYRVDNYNQQAYDWKETTQVYVSVGCTDSNVALTAANVKFTWRTTATAGGSDAAESGGIVSGNSSATFGYSSSASREGIYYLGYTVTAKNANGETFSAQDYAGPYYIDNKAPSQTTYSAYYADDGSEYNGEWTNREVHTQFTSTDKGSGVSSFQYKLNGGSWYTAGLDASDGDISKSGTTYTGIEPWNLRERNDTYTFRAVDGLEHKSTASSSFTIKYDLTAPTFTSAEIKNVSSTGYDVYVYGVSDTASGISRVQFPTWTGRADNTDDQDDLVSDWGTSSAVSGTDMGNGTWYYRVNTADHNNEDGWYNTHIYVYDNAGNRTNASGSIVGDDEDTGRVYIDRTPPQITIDTDSELDEAQTWKKEHTVTVTLSDDYRGLASGASVKYGWSTTTDTEPSSYTTATLSYTEGATEITFEAVGSELTGKYYLWVVPETLQDLNANSQNSTAISSYTYWFDNTTPTITFNPQQNETWAKSQSVTVNIGDAHSGLAAGVEHLEYQWVAEGETPSDDEWLFKNISEYTEGANSVTFSVTNSTLTGKYKLYVKSPEIIDTSLYNGNVLSIGEIMSSDGYFWFDNTKPMIEIDPTEESTPSVVTDGLIRHYNATNNTGNGHDATATTWKDLSGNQDATLYGGATVNENHISLDGTNDYIDLGTLEGISSAEGLTIQMAFKATKGSAIFSFDGIDQGNYYCSDYDDDGTVWTDFVEYDGETAYCVTGVLDLSSDLVFLTWTLDDLTQETVRDSEGRELVVGGTGSLPASWVNIISNSDLNVGANMNKNTRGKLDLYSIMIYDRYLTTEEIVANYTAISESGSIEDSLIRHYDASNNTGGGYDETSTVWADLTGNHNIVLPNPNATLYGDIDGDGVVTEDDAIYLFQHIMMPEHFPLTEETRANADVNLDGILNEDDAIMIQQYVEGTATLPEPGTIFENEYLYIENRRIKHRRI